MYLSALELGFTMQDLKELKFARVLFFLRVRADEVYDARREAKGHNSGNTVRQARQSDIMGMLCM